ncbi:MAG: endonuclease III [Victivallaceae bacterium]|nr:endonuclease III [Victivallaceae bacterium]
MIARRPPKGKKALLAEVNRILFAKYGTCLCPLRHDNPFQLLVAVELSAQCTDVRVNQITRELFKKYPDAESFAGAPVADIENLIRAGGLFRSKARNIISAAKSVVENFDGKVPATMKELTTLPGIGRKSANVLLGNAFNIPGFPVDTHVKRVLKRIGVTNSGAPEKIEAEVNALIGKKYWTNLSHMLILHGRKTCSARKPDCPNCIIKNLCEYYNKG